MLTPTEVYNSPNHGTRRSSTSLIILHSTRGGASSLEREYRGAINWFMNPLSQVSAHAIIASNGDWAGIVDWDLIAWHAGQHNPYSIGIELVQPRIGDLIYDEQYTTTRLILSELFNIYGHIDVVEHKDTPQGISVGKSDIGEPFDIRKVFKMPRTPEQQLLIDVANGWSGNNPDSNNNLRSIANWIDCGALNEQANNLRRAANQFVDLKDALEREWPL